MYYRSVRLSRSYNCARRDRVHCRSFDTQPGLHVLGSIKTILKFGILLYSTKFFQYFDQVKASTEIGFGPETTPYTVSSHEETAIPHLVIFTANLLWLADLDKHSSLNQSLGT